MIKNLINIIRLPNILIVATTQFLVYSLIIKDAFNSSNARTLLIQSDLFLLILITTLITISGYIINDIFDIEIDFINKPKRRWINNRHLIRNARFAYLSLVIFGGVLSLYLAISISHIYWFFIYPLAILLLYIYAAKLKSTILFGNVMVSFFCAAVVGVLLFAEWDGFVQLIHRKNPYAIWGLHVLIAYMSFAFFSNFIRELIKDIEDMEGDKKWNVITFPVKFGVSQAKNVGLAITGAMILSLSFWIYFDLVVFDNIYSFIIGIILILIMSFFMYNLWKAKSKLDYKQLSAFSKIIMASGLVMLVLLKLNYA